MQPFRTVTTALVAAAMLIVGYSWPFAQSAAPPASTAQARVSQSPTRQNGQKLRVLVDTDANNELDDQHALAYLLFNGGVFDVEGITVNTTRGGGDISQQVAEARRVLTLCTLHGQGAVEGGRQRLVHADPSAPRRSHPSTAPTP